MVKVSVEVRNGTARFRVAVQAESAERALALVTGTYPGREAVRVGFPTGAEGIFAADTVRAGMVEQPEKLAA
jgi:hypothetical protein